MNFIIPLISVLLPIIGATVGFFLKAYIDKRHQLLGEVTKERREHYQQFVNLVIDIFSANKTGKPIPESDYQKKLFDFYKKYILYASPEVINTFSDYFQYLYSTKESDSKLNAKIHFRKLSRIMKSMRTDLGLSNEELGDDGEMIFRALINDFDSQI